jgi:hypothetical protein
MTASKKYKRMPISRYGFPMKIKIIHPQKGRPKENHYMKKMEMFLEYTQWASLPSALREPKTQKDWSLKWGVTEATLSRWKSRPEFWEQIANRRREWAKDKTSDVIHGLFRNASTRGEAAEVKLWLEAVEDWSEKAPPSSPNITIIGIKGITEADIQKLVQPEEKAEVIEGETI